VNVMASLRAELLKLRKRPAVWILLLLLAAAVLLFGYVLLYAIATQTPGEAATAGLDDSAIISQLRPDNLPSQVLAIVSGFGGALGLVLGALIAGSEYGWQTVKTMTTQRPQRLALITGRLLAVLVVCATLTLAAFLGGAAGTALLSLVRPAQSAAPALLAVVSAFGAAVLIIGVWCAIGFCLATLFRGTGWAIGLGLIYTFAVESVLGLLPLQGRAADIVARALIDNNAAALAAAVSANAPAAFGVPTVDIAVPQAVAVLLAYVAVAVLLATTVFVRRDIG
jgi:ABC-2 type transport system permease protein